MEVFAVGKDGMVRGTWFLDGQWHQWYVIGGGRFSETAGLATVSRVPEHLEVLAIGEDGMVRGNWFKDSQWHAWYAIAHGNFEAVVLAGHELWHWFHDSPDFARPWQRGRRVTGGGDVAEGPGCLIQSTIGRRGNFEVVVPLRNTDGTAALWHFFHDNDAADGEWRQGRRVTGDGDSVVGPGCLIQSDFGSRGNFEVIVPLRLSDGRIETISFTLSVWNPYQVMLMTATLPAIRW